MSDLIQKAIEQTERAQFGLCCAEAVHALDMANERIEALEQLLAEYKNAECRAVKAEGEALAKLDAAHVASLVDGERIEALEAERDDCARVNRDMCAENVRLKAKLDAVSKLPDKWHEIIRNLSDSQRLCMHPLNECANDLKAALQEQEDE